MNNLIKRIFIAILKVTAFLSLAFILVFLVNRFSIWRYNQKHEAIIKIEATPEFQGCANENFEFKTLKVDNAKFNFLVGEVISPTWKNNKTLDSIYETDGYKEKKVEITGQLYKHKSNVKVSSMDCDVIAYRIRVISLKIL
ncbi:hypothetical protein I5M27_06145 [Adhaeribacter sp. BT258]|uniref:Uncharacterized protein n=1 Tax=Adhaeribacter terrigena TaxID=2793070 RepID=A0ABS1C1P7_9BACT|nr:hypothetical protein [Adhaeribacter terrigena]MBK0402558.1 hypothetical protein [Adhaeribacter terrigena]